MQIKQKKINQDDIVIILHNNFNINLRCFCVQQVFVSWIHVRFVWFMIRC